MQVGKSSNEYAPIIEQNMRAGTVGPKEITVAILKSHMREASRKGADLFILDGMWIGVVALGPSESAS